MSLYAGHILGMFKLKTSYFAKKLKHVTCIIMFVNVIDKISKCLQHLLTLDISYQTFAVHNVSLN